MPTTRPTSEQVATEASLLERIAPLVRERSFFGDSNRDAIEAQARVLKEGMSHDDVHDTFEPSDDDEDPYDGRTQHVFDNALSARDWAAGMSDERPSVGWIDLVPAEQRAALEEPPAPRRLISSDEAVQAKCQHKTPCSDCPWARTALNGWLGGASIDEWLRTAHSDTHVDCHTLKGAQCAGLAIYRKNVVKRVEPPLLALPGDEVKVFSTPMEFRAHHEGKPTAKAANDSTATRRKAA